MESTRTDEIIAAHHATLLRGYLASEKLKKTMQLEYTRRQQQVRLLSFDPYGRKLPSEPQSRKKA